MQCCALPEPHPSDVDLVQIHFHEQPGQVGHRQQRLSVERRFHARSHGLAGINRASDDGTVEGRLDTGVPHAIARSAKRDGLRGERETLFFSLVLERFELGSGGDSVRHALLGTLQAKLRELESILGTQDIHPRASDLASVVHRIEPQEHVARVHPIALVHADLRHETGDLALQLDTLLGLDAAHLDDFDRELTALRRHDLRFVDGLRLGSSPKRIRTAGPEDDDEPEKNAPLLPASFSACHAVASQARENPVSMITGSDARRLSSEMRPSRTTITRSA